MDEGAVDENEVAGWFGLRPYDIETVYLPKGDEYQIGLQLKDGRFFILADGECTEGNLDEFASLVKPVDYQEVNSNRSISGSTFNVGDRVRQAWANPSNIGVIEDVMDDNTYGVRWDYSDGDDLEYVSGEDLDMYSEDTDSIEDETIDITEYAEALGLAVLDFLNQQGFEGYSSIEDDYLEIEILGEEDEEPEDDTFVYIQPLSDIDPVWEDLDSDAATLAEEVLDEYFDQ